MSKILKFRRAGDLCGEDLQGIPLRTPCNVSVNSVDQGDNSGEEMVDRSGHTQRTSDLHKKTEAEYLERDEEGARRPQKSLPGCPIISTCRNGVRRKQKRCRFRSWFSAECLFGEERILANSRLLATNLPGHRSSTLSSSVAPYTPRACRRRKPRATGTSVSSGTATGAQLIASGCDGHGKKNSLLFPRGLQ